MKTKTINVNYYALYSYITQGRQKPKPFAKHSKTHGYKHLNF